MFTKRFNNYTPKLIIICIGLNRTIVIITNFNGMRSMPVIFYGVEKYYRRVFTLKIYNDNIFPEVYIFLQYKALLASPGMKWKNDRSVLVLVPFLFR